MNKSFLFLCLTLVLVNKAFARNEKGKPAVPNGISTSDYIPNTLIVKYKDVQQFGAKSLNQSSTLKKSVIEITGQKQFLNLNLANQSLANQRKLDNNGLNRIFEITYKSNKSIQEVINTLMAEGNLEYAEPLYLNKTFANPNDPDLSLQNSLSQIKASEAWAVQPDASGVIIAIIDSGSDLDHPDLAANIHVNNLEIPNNGIDDDQDGFIDNYHGWDFVGATSNFVEDNDPNVKSESADHGVHVSGIAAAVTNNNIGVASLAKNAKLMILKAGADNNASDIYPTAAYKAIVYAVNKGAKIINCSWGRNSGPPSEFEQNIINYAVQQGCLIVAAAGNDGNQATFYPAGYNGVFAVANVSANDVKAGSSNYGYHIAISAPGTSVYNTTFNDSYGYKSGTSMAAPLVASAAALVWAKYPQFNGGQIAELLKLGADDIYALSGNRNYANRLGAGRLNVLNALNAGGVPAIRAQNVYLDDSFGARSSGDTLKFKVDIKNLLQEATNLSVNLSSTSTKVEILNPDINIGAIQTLEDKSTSEFKVLLKPNLVENEALGFKLTYSSAPESYSYSEYFSVNSNIDFINYQVNTIATTATSNGKIGYTAYDAVNGIGFNYKNTSLLYESALMIGISNNQVADNARTSGGNANNHFIKKEKIKREIDSIANFKSVAVFTDAGKYNNALGLEVTNQHFAFKNAPNDNFIIAQYDIKNTNNTALNNVHIGLFTDWDIAESSLNVSKYSADLRLAYAYSFDNSTAPYAGVKLLNNDSRSHYYPISYMLTDDITYDDNFSEADKYKTLSSGIFKNSLGETENGLDVMSVSASGPYTIAAGATVKVAFAVLAADNLADLKTAATQAQETYELLNKVNTEVISAFELSQNYPNPVSDILSLVDVKLPEEGNLAITLYNIMGKEVATVVNQNFIAGKHKIELNTSELKNGIYYCIARYKGKSKSIKIIVSR